MLKITVPELLENATLPALIARIKVLTAQRADHSAPALTIAEANELESSIRTAEFITNVTNRKPTN
jgi:hypothetical protein